MRNLLTAALAGASVLGSLALVQTAQAQPYDGYDRPAPGYAAPSYGAPGYYDSYGNYHRYDQPPTAYTPYNGYYASPGPGPGYDDSGAAAIAGSALGAAIGGYAYGGPPADELGPDPNGMIAPDGHRIKCKNRSDWDDYRHAYVTRRLCD
ncbi:MAG: hypothetical protein JWQ52_2101 [Phenylobacterium sp.]|jgi:hypothetical protein|nr:hypothetical protein [Phenylobacterium sp.]